MSWQATAWVIEHSKQKGSNLLTLLCIANCANETGTNAFPSIERLAKDTRLAARQVRRIVRQLEDSGELVTERHSSGRYPNHYSLPLMNTGEHHRVPVSITEDANPDILTGSKTVTQDTDLNPDISTLNPDILWSNPDIAMSPDPSVRSSSKNDQEKKGVVTKQQHPKKAGLPSPFPNKAFLALLDDFVEHRKELKKPLTERARKILYKQLAELGEIEATKALERAIANGWRGVVFESRNGNGHQAPEPYKPPGEKPFRPTVEQLMRVARIATIEEAREIYAQTAWAEQEN